MKETQVQALLVTWLFSICVLLAPSAVLSAPVFEEDEQVRSGLSAYHQGDYAKALEVLDLPARRGNIEAQRTLGIMYLLGKGTPQDPATAARWIRGAASLGDPHAQELLSFMHNQGLGVPQDYVMAYVWLKLAIVQTPDPQREQARQAAIARLMTLIPREERGRARNLSRQYYNRHVKPFL